MSKHRPNRLLTDALREIRKTMSRFLSLFLLSALAVAFLAGLRTTAPDMERTADAYYDAHGLMDLRVLSTLGLTEEDISVLAAQEGVSAAEGAYTVDAMVHLPENDVIIKVLSLSPTGINAPDLLEGRLPENARECLVEPELLDRTGLSIGDVLTLDTGDGAFEDALAYGGFTIVGVANSPLYLSVDRGTSSLGSGRVAAFALLPMDSFTMDAYTDAYLLASGAAGLYCYDQAYGDLTDALADALEPLSDQRAALRYDQVVGEANEKLSDAQKEYDDAEAKANRELEDARQKLEDARKKLDDGWAEWRDGKAALARETADAKGKIADAEADLPDALRKLEDGEADYARGVRDLEDGKAKYADGLQDWQDGKIEYNRGYLKLLSGEDAYTENRQKLLDGQQEYDDGMQDYLDGLSRLEDAGAQLTDARKRLADAKLQIDDGLTELSNGRSELAAGQAQVDAGQARVDAGRDQLNGLKGQLDQGLGYLVLLLNANGGSFADAAALRDPAQWTPQLSMVAGALMGSMAGELQTQLAALVAQGALTQEQADALALQFQTQLAAAAGGDTAAIPTLLLTLDAALADAQAQLDAGQAQLDASRKQLAAGQAQLDQGSVSLGHAMEQYKAGKKEYEDGLAQLQEKIPDIQQAHDQLADAKAQLDDGWARLSKGRRELDDGWAGLGDAADTLDDGWAELEDARAKIDDGGQELLDARQKLDDGWREYDDGVAQLADAKERLPRETADARQKLDDAHVELTDGEQEYTDGLKEYQDGRREAEEKLSDARQKLNDARRKIRDIENCKWYVLGRNTNMGYVSYQQDAERMGNLASVFPLIFFLVAALVCLTTMQRMVEEQRVQIGSLKALGYGKGQIALKYVGYGFLASFLGGVLGLVVGCTLIPFIIFNAWKIMYTVGDLIIHFLPSISLLSVGAAVFCVTGTALAACFATLAAVPAELMRPRAPKPGKRVLLERIRPVWKHLSFTWKVTVRNLFRYKKRFWMTVIGIGGCTALLITGFGLRDSIHDIFDKQYDEITTYSAQVSLLDDVTDDELSEIARALDTDPLVAEWMSVSNTAITAESAKRSMDSSVYLFAVTDQERFGDFVHLRHRQDGAPVTLPEDGAVLTEKLADMLGVKVGDTITLVDGDNRRAEVTVSDLTENYVFHYVYLSAACYQSLFGEPPAINSLMVTYTEDTQANSDAVAARLIPLSGVSAVTRIESTKETFVSGMEGVDYAVVVVTIAAAALAFVVLFNLTNINITERLRELATLKVLGFYPKELSAYVYRENVFLTLFGVLMGLVMGKYLHQWLVLTVEIDMVMFGRSAKPTSYLYAIVLTILFSFLVNLAARARLKKINMVESLKTVD